MELSSQIPRRREDSGTDFSDLRRLGQPDLAKAPQALDEIARPELIRHKDKRFLFYFSNDTTYRHHAPDKAFFDRNQQAKCLKAVFRCYEDYDRAAKLLLRFKIEHVARSEQFEVVLNGRRINPQDQSVLYASNGRDTRIHTVKLGPYLYYEISLKPAHWRRAATRLRSSPRGSFPTSTVRSASLRLTSTDERPRRTIG